MIRVLLVAGARPNFMKVMPLLSQMRKFPKKFKPTLAHTGQHYDFNMSDKFFQDLDIPKPDIYLGVGSSTHGAQTAKILEAIEKILLKERFDLVIVVGDVNSTIAAAMAAAKLGVRVAHVEAGLRSFDKSMPEEINRLLTDHISDFLFTTEDYGARNLLREGIDSSKIFFVGNIMIDSYKMNTRKIKNSRVLKKLGLPKKDYCLVTIHRPSNVDIKRELKKVTHVLEAVSRRITVVFPMHPRTKKMINKFKVKLKKSKDIILLGPVGYIDFQKLLEGARFVMTDSGGIQEEATFKNIPCLTLRDATERPVTVIEGSNELTGINDKEEILGLVQRVLDNRWKKAKRPALWDGRTAHRIVRVLMSKEKAICQG